MYLFCLHIMDKNHAESTADETSMLYNNLPVLNLFTSPKTYNDGHFYYIVTKKNHRQK